MNLRRLLPAIALTAIVALTAACGGDDDDKPTPAASAAVTPAASPANSPTACPTVQTTNVSQIRFESSGPQAPPVGVMDDVTLTQDPCFDEIVFEFEGTVPPGYTVEYVQAATQCGSGEPVTTQGPAQIEARFIPADAHDMNGNSTIPARMFTPNFPSLKEAVLSCDFEAHVNWVLGTEEKGFNVTVQQNPTRVVIDIYH